ncbi:DMT family transporter [Halobacteriaceae archaeon GCM10025711]
MKHRDTALFLTLAGVWGASFVAIKTGLTGIPPVLFAAFRYDLAGVALLAVALATSDRWRPQSREEWEFVVVGGALLIGVHFSLLFVGQQYVTGTIGAVVASITPVLTPVFAWALLPRTHLRLRTGLGAVLGLLGVTIIAQPNPAALDDQALGVAILAIAMASFALGSVLTVRMPGHLPIVPAQAWMMLVGAGLLHATSAALPSESLAAVEWSAPVVVSLVYLALVASAAGFVIYFHLLERLGPVEISLVNYVTPAFAAVTGWLLLGEPVASTTVLGFTVILVGFSVLKWNVVSPFLADVRTHLHGRYDKRSVRDRPVTVTDGGVAGQDCD